MIRIKTNLYAFLIGGFDDLLSRAQRFSIEVLRRGFRLLDFGNAGHGSFDDSSARCPIRPSGPKHLRGERHTQWALHLDTDDFPTDNRIGGSDGLFNASEHVQSVHQLRLEKISRERGIAAQGNGYF